MDILSVGIATKAAKKYTDEAIKGVVGGEVDYSKLKDKPKINGVELNGDLSTNELGIGFETDSELNKTSENPIQNQAVAKAIEEVESKIPTVDTELSETSRNPVENRVVTKAVNGLIEKESAFYDFEMTNGFYASANPTGIGLLAVDATCSVTGFIRVKPNSKVYVSNAFLQYNRAICGYTKSREPISPVIAKNKGNNPVNLEIDISEDTYYIRVTCKKDERPQLMYTNQIDAVLSETSINPVQNAVITKILNDLDTRLKKLEGTSSTNGVATAEESI